ncbi:MAG: hypothetical protein H7X97_01470 [Opitutaceae bacterium]|nr:hypothetical protein [Verrucomicrobiales bacterium]
MKKSFVGLAGTALILICGCTQGVPGGPGAPPASPPATNQTANKPIIGEAKETFTLSVPLLATSLKQGEAKVIDISINRGTNLDADVTLSFSELPTGLSVNPPSPGIMHGESKVSITLTAADDAALGDFVVKVTGHPSKGGVDAVNDLKLTVTEK